MGSSPTEFVGSFSRQRGPIGRAHDGLRDWCAAHSAGPRLLILAGLVYVAARHFADPDYISLFYWLNFGIHEVGHVFTRPLPPALRLRRRGHHRAVRRARRGDLHVQASGRSLLGIARLRGSGSLRTSTTPPGTSADARLQQIPTAPIFGEPTTSDWTYLLGKMRILHWDVAISGFLYAAAYAVMTVAIAVGAYMVFLLLRTDQDGEVGGTGAGDRRPGFSPGTDRRLEIRRPALPTLRDGVKILLGPPNRTSGDVRTEAQKHLHEDDRGLRAARPKRSQGDDLQLRPHRLFLRPYRQLPQLSRRPTCSGAWSPATATRSGR